MALISCSYPLRRDYALWRRRANVSCGLNTYVLLDLPVTSNSRFLLLILQFGRDMGARLRWTSPARFSGLRSWISS